MPDKYGLLKGLVATGNDMNTMVKESSQAYKHIDAVVTGTTSRWQQLVDALKTIEEELSSVLIIWQVC